MKGLSFFLVFVLVSFVFAEQSNSILVVNRKNARTLIKTDPGQVTQLARSVATNVDQIVYRGYYIKLQPVGATYNMQVYTMVHYGNLTVSSVFATQFQTAVEYAYSFDSTEHRIRQDHFLFPANSLTGWANPDEYVLMRRFDWGQKFPDACDGSVFTSEEFGREYLETSCFNDRDAAISFAKKFVNYALSRRGL